MADYEQEPLRVRDNRRSYGIFVMVLAGLAVLALFWPRIMPNRVVDTRTALDESLGAAPHRMAAAVVSMDALAETRTDSLYMGNRVMVDEAKVLGTLSSRAFWIGETWEDRVLVAIQPGRIIDLELKQGDEVDVVGLVQKLALDDSWLKQRRIPEQAVLNLKDRWIFVEAEALEIDRDDDFEVGEVVHLNDVTVQDLKPSRGFTAVEEDKDRLWVALPPEGRQEISRQDIHNGDVVDVIGVVRERVLNGNRELYVEAQTLDKDVEDSSRNRG